MPGQPAKVEYKDILAGLSLAGDFYAFAASRSGPLLIVVGLIASALGIIWACLERKNRRGLFQALSYLFLFVGPIVLLFFIVVGSVIAFGEPPPPNGNRLANKPSSFKLAAQGTTAELSGNYKLTFSEAAGRCEVIFMPTDESRPLLQRIEVTGIHGVTPGETGKLTALSDGGNETSFEIENPSPNYEAILDFRVVMKKPIPDPSVNILVSHVYTQKNLTWRIKRWIFDHFGG